MEASKQVNLAIYRTTIRIGASRFRQVSWYFVNILFFKNPLVVLSSAKRALLRLFGAKVGAGVVIKPSVNIKFPWKLRIGDHSWIGEGVWIDNLSDVVIGNHVALSQGCLLLTGSHDHRKETFDFLTAPITLEDGVWICARATVLGGTTCRSHSILTANSVSGGDLDPYTIYKGNPATAIKTRTIL
ncbi:WcaF family extracellular polysaccharide biosynthesis acetyltransferase [Flavitalea sp. BT771]|uniref:WcaF family extracellular polysaccharide biosynthesis acetyltransferase n=1 Tax=Flavitalea sp. BT771 TaxID=3063329 RepID=UPI0026E3F584|nr:WcaF family extracellular polysaccharide biosynthesis acetyltransferase [Flavitalea sp. BT771]MDO6434141.1 WcaF family extracellular polysaccharide biosynthesis acetyltransferase [Flavitalea sp. BT771]MDV6223041.1 WcaF family extracellular polysaccharide biosynthesis acetyltransferase [Flavitalea sp. BT771]